MDDTLPKAEEAYLGKVQDFLDSEIERLGKLSVTELQRLKSAGRKFNEDNPNGGMYAGMELTELHYEMEKQLANAERAKLDSAFYKKLRLSPYFARVDFVPDGAAHRQRVYIGLRTLQDPETFDTFVCDWRAPISSLFYEEFRDEAYFQAPMGRITGHIALRRQFTIREGKLERFVDSEIKIDDEILRETLSGNAGEKLKVIVGSIQREQNRAIRFSRENNLLVVGPAGSGKTSVGFHRLAYLLYRCRSELTSSEIVMFSNNDIFTSYVADIIPELGEMPINYASFYSVFQAELPDYAVRDYYALADALVQKDTARRESVRVKLGEDFLDYLFRRAVAYDFHFSDIRFADWTILSASALAKRFQKDEENSLQLRTERLIAFAKTEVDEFFRAHNAEIYALLDRDSALDEDTSKVLIARRRALKHEAGEAIRAAVLCDPVKIYEAILGEYLENTGGNPQILTSLQENLRSTRVLSFEDALCTLYVKAAAGTLAVLSGVKQVLLDEAQDLCMLQHRILKAMFPAARFTLLADGNQAIVPEINTPDAQALASFYQAQVLQLKKSYRSTAEINRFALSLLPPSSRYDVFERPGEEVHFVCGKEPIRTLAVQLAAAFALSPSVAVITKTVGGARALHRLLRAEGCEVALCDNHSATLREVPTVIPLVLTKGLEFDSVFVWNPDGAFDGAADKPYLYMAVTRALHRLTVLSGTGTENGCADGTS